MAYSPSFINDYLQRPDLTKIDDLDGKTGVIQLNPIGVNESIPVVYGLQRVEGPIIYQSTARDNSNILYLAIALSEGQCNRIYRIFLDGEMIIFAARDPLPHNQINYPTINTTYRPTNRIADRILAIEFMDGRSGQGASGLLQEIYGVNSSFQPPTFPNLCYVVVKMTYRGQTSPYKQVPKITVDLSGKIIKDLTQYLINPFDPGFWPNDKRSTNPADILLDYLTNTIYGAGLPYDKIDLASFKTVNAYFSTNQVKYGTQDTDLYECNMVMDTALPVRDNVKKLLDQFGLILHFTNGAYRLQIEGQTLTSSAITDDDIIGQIVIQEPDAGVKFNQFTVEFPFVGDRNAFYDFQIKRITFPTTEDFATNPYLVEDGNIINQGTLSCPGVTNFKMAHVIAKRMLLKSRNQKTYRFSMLRRGFQFTVGDILSVTTTLPSLSNQLMRIISMQINDDFTVDLECVTHDNDFYPPYDRLIKEPPTTPIIPQPNLPGNGPGQPLPAGTPSIGINPPGVDPGYPEQGDPGSVINLPPEVIPANDYSINIVQAEVGTSDPLLYNSFLRPVPPNLPNAGKSGGLNNDWYLGAIEKDKNNLAVNGQYGIIYTNIHSLDTRSGVGYNFGIQHRIGELKTPGATNNVITYQMSPCLTYRYQNQEGESAGKYKDQDQLYFVYSIGYTNGGGYIYGWREIEAGGQIASYIVDPEKSNVVQKKVFTKTTGLTLTSIAETFMPRLYFNQHSKYPNIFPGGWYGGIADSSVARHWLTCVQQNVGTVQGTFPRIPLTTQTSRFFGDIPDNLFKFKIFAKLGNTFEYIGTMDATFNNLGQYQTVLYRTESRRNYLSSGFSGAPF